MITPLLAFALTSTLLILAPGPDSLLVMRNTLRDGRRAGWITACGTLSGLLVWAMAAALGLAALLRASQLGYDLLRLTGAGYLIWLGASSLGPRRKHAGTATGTGTTGTGITSSGTAGTGITGTGITGTGITGTGTTGTGTTGTGNGEPACRPPAGATRRRPFLNGLLSNLLNPKIGVFFLAFLPGCIPAGASAMTFSFVLGLWFIAETGAWLATVTWLAARGASWLRRPAVQRWLERGTGLALIGFGLRLVTEAR
jgi:threonine/homoserine/homoserine lactone efflux protein